jgi:hypothetical protein
LRVQLLVELLLRMPALTKMVVKNRPKTTGEHILPFREGRATWLDNLSGTTTTIGLISKGDGGSLS